jgi:4-hydroxybenzoate polyprenyltransferase
VTMLMDLQSAFACVAGPISSFYAIVHAIVWLWLHLLQCNVSNQYTGYAEDALNKPWRPIPAGRISISSAFRLRWALPFICLAWSAPYGARVVGASLLTALYAFVYDECGGAKQWAIKNMSCVFAYFALELGATVIAVGGPSSELDSVATRALFYSAAIFASTLHAADFPDVVGDAAQGRITIPMLFPKGSRVVFMITLIAWSLHLVSNVGWAVGPISATLFVMLGAWVGARVVWLTTPEEDKKSYNYYDVWLLTAFMLPAQARWGVFSF